ncbi:hypothetical protein [Arsenicibacter rosenii]|uniref:Uncharacterized protein n=1 Tax=Arsenicibacter rosenii TaxID=1750698 RepID=A0A1S2VEM3_9BACT|nr:hypothetical protein [Arsenicibacter rosenii]OIN57174.1 hypothetical protein BLX24_20640 [Arsenicibacter rosenii]
MDTSEELTAKALDANWENLIGQLEKFIGKRPADLNSVLFLIGMQELGRGPKRFTKEQKQDLLHIATCSVLSLRGYYRFDGFDLDGWPQYSLQKPVPRHDLSEQEVFLKEHVILYFEHHQLI